MTLFVTGSTGFLGRRLLAPAAPWLETTRMWGVPVCDSGSYFQDKVLAIAQEFQQRFQARAEDREQRAPISAAEIGVLDGYKGPAYAVPYPEEIALIREVAREDALFLDPVYTGRAFGGLLDLIRRGVFQREERVLFWHTGGTAGMFGYGERAL